MQTRMLVLLSVCMMLPSAASGDDTSDKLDAVLKEMKKLNERIGRLEAEVALLRHFQPADPDTAVKAKQYNRHFKTPQLKATTTPAEVLRLQSEDPGALLKNIHMRERALRNRGFPADVIPSNPFR